MPGLHTPEQKPVTGSWKHDNSVLGLKNSGNFFSSWQTVSFPNKYSTSWS